MTTVNQTLEILQPGTSTASSNHAPTAVTGTQEAVSPAGGLRLLRETFNDVGVHGRGYHGKPFVYDGVAEPFNHELPFNVLIDGKKVEADAEEIFALPPAMNTETVVMILDRLALAEQQATLQAEIVREQQEYLRSAYATIARLRRKLDSASCPTCEEAEEDSRDRRRENRAQWKGNV